VFNEELAETVERVRRFSIPPAPEPKNIMDYPEPLRNMMAG
jgi:hypothetical protein